MRSAEFGLRSVSDKAISADVRSLEKDPCQRVWQVNQFGCSQDQTVNPDPCRLVRQVNEFAKLAAEKLLHLPREAAGVEKNWATNDQAFKLALLPDELAGGGKTSN